jgi:putative colanic acid biosynthesis glycosyltransferase
MTASPSLSIIVVCQNPGSQLAHALESVWAQHWATPDIVIVDLGSKDGTREWLETQRARLAVLQLESEMEIAEGMNQAVAAAQGEWIHFLGADDRLVGDMVLSEVLNWTRKTEAGVVAGEAAYDDGRLFRLRSHVNPLFRNFVHHPSAFYRRSLFAENGGFDVSLRTQADYDFNLRLWKSRVRFKPIPLRIAACRSRPESTANAWRRHREEIAVRHRFFPAWRCWLWDVLTIGRFLLGRMRH